mmetsp:Transcript_105848/g.299414  ORF Transcript_105848/g.299414 Transcript_105848/m.299414 type:complete len:559 (+) Transcript_105848:157-1833(+)
MLWCSSISATKRSRSGVPSMTRVGASVVRGAVRQRTLLAASRGGRASRAAHATMGSMSSRRNSRRCSGATSVPRVGAALLQAPPGTSGRRPGAAKRSTTTLPPRAASGRSGGGARRPSWTTRRATWTRTRTTRTGRGGSSSSEGPRSSLPVKSASSVRPDPDTGAPGPESFKPGATNLTKLSAEHGRGAASDDVVPKVRPAASSSADNDLDDDPGGLPVISASKLLAKIGSSPEKAVSWRSGPEHPSRPMAGPHVPALGEVLGKLDAEEVSLRPVLEDIGEESWPRGPREARLWQADRDLAEAVQLNPENTWSFETTIGRGGDKLGPESVNDMRERCEHAFEDMPNTRLRAPAAPSRPEKKDQRKAAPEKVVHSGAPQTEWFTNAPTEEQWWDEWQGEEPQLTVTDAMRELLGAGTRGRGRGAAGKGAGRGEKPRTIEAGKQWGQREEERQRKMWELGPNLGGKSSEQEGGPPRRRSEGLPGFKGLKPSGGRSETGLSKLRWEKDTRPCAQTPEGAKPEEARGSPLERRPLRCGRCEPSYCTVNVFREDCWQTFPSGS